MSHLWKKVNVACFNSYPMKCSSSDCYGSSDSLLHARLPPAMRRSGTKTHATAMQTGFLHSQTKWDYFLPLRLFQASVSCCVSAVLRSILHFCTSKEKKKRKKKEKSRYNRKGSRLPVFTYRAEGLLIIHIIHFSPPLNVFFCARRYELSAGL